MADPVDLETLARLCTMCRRDRVGFAHVEECPRCGQAFTVCKDRCEGVVFRSCAGMAPDVYAKKLLHFHGYSCK